MRRFLIGALLPMLMPCSAEAQPYARLPVAPIPNANTLPSCEPADAGSWLQDMSNGTLRCECQGEACAWEERAITQSAAVDACAAWPVGSIFISTTATNPAMSLGCGTWTPYAAGRVLIGVDAGQTEFDVAEEVGGAKSHALTTAEMPAHTHTVTDPGHAHVTQRYPTATGGSSGFTIDTSMSGTPADNTLTTKSATTGVTVNSTGNGDAFSTLPPYVAVYIFVRAG